MPFGIHTPIKGGLGQMVRHVQNDKGDAHSLFGREELDVGAELGVQNTVWQDVRGYHYVP